MLSTVYNELYSVQSYFRHDIIQAKPYSKIFLGESKHLCDSSMNVPTKYKKNQELVNDDDWYNNSITTT